MDIRRLPLGFGMALAQNEAAMARFATMTEEEKQSVIERTHQVRSRRDMQRLVDSLTTDPDDGQMR